MEAPQDLGNKQLVRLRKSLTFTGFTRPLSHEDYISRKNTKSSKLSDMSSIFKVMQRALEF